MILYSVFNVCLFVTYAHVHWSYSILLPLLEKVTFYRYVKHDLATNDNSADNLIISQLYQLHSLAFVIKGRWNGTRGTNSMEKEGYGKIIIY